MINQKNILRLSLFLLLLAPFPVAAQSQSDVKPPEKPDLAVEKRQLDEVLKAEVEQLKAMVEQQRRLLAEMQKRLDDVEGKTQALAATPAALVSRPAAQGVDALPSASPVALTKTAAKEEPTTQSTPAQGTPPAGQARPAMTAGWDRNHALLRSADGAFETNFAGYAQLDFRGYQDGVHPPNSFFLRRARLSLEGKLHRYFDYKLEGDFADAAGTALRDAFVRIHRIEELQFTFGQFRVPISQEEIRSDNVQDFVERSLVNNLVPSRSPGMMASGIINKGVFEYQLGAFNGKGLLAANTTNTPEVALRLRFNPLKNTDSFWGKGFIFGGAVTQGRHIGLSARGQTESRSFIFYVPQTVNGKFIRANGEMTWLLGPATVRAEYVQTNQERENLGAGGTNLPGVVGKGYMGQFTYLLTGETKPEAGAVSPKVNVFEGDPGKYGLGAWEVKFRYANLQLADTTSRTNRAETFYFGANWYLNRFVRYLLDFGVERFKDPTRLPKPGDNNYFVILSRIQFAF